MTGKTHLTGGLAAGITLERLSVLAGVPLLSPGHTVQLGTLALPVVLIALVTVAAGSLMPDLDEPNSLASNAPRASRTFFRRLIPAGLIRGAVELLLLAVNQVTRLLSKLVRVAAGGHRAGTHQLVTALGVSLIAAVLGFPFGFPMLGLWLGLGYLSHIALDMMTISGVPVLEPFSERDYHLLPPGFRIRTGGPMDTLVAVLCLFIAAGAGYAHCH